MRSATNISMGNQPDHKATAQALRKNIKHARSHRSIVMSPKSSMPELTEMDDDEDSKTNKGMLKKKVKNTLGI